MFQLNYIYKALNNNRCYIAGQRRESECAIYQLVYLFTYINAIPFKIFNENKLKGIFNFQAPDQEQASASCRLVFNRRKRRLSCGLAIDVPEGCHQNIYI